MRTFTELYREYRNDRINKKLRAIWDALYDIRDEIMETLQTLTEKSNANLELATGLQTSIDAFQEANTNLKSLYESTAAELQALKDSNAVDATLLEPLAASLNSLGTALTTLQTDILGEPVPASGRRTNITGNR